MKTSIQLILGGLLISFMSCTQGDDSGGLGTYNAAALAPTLTTTDVSSVTSSTAISGGSISNNGGAAIIASGVCYSTNHSPTINDHVVYANSNANVFTVMINTLSLNVKYYVRAFATNSGATGYGDELSFFTAIAVGQNYQGGIVFYVDNKGGHGLILSTHSFSVVQWGCDGDSLTGAAGTSIGTGAQNTDNIFLQCTTSGIAASSCHNVNDGGYTDWFLPSLDELLALYAQRRAVVNLGTGIYWSSSQQSYDNANCVSFSNGSVVQIGKSTPENSVAIRAF